MINALIDVNNPQLSNQVIIETTGPNGTVKVSTYLEDQYMLESALLCILSVMSFYPTMYFMQTQANRRVGLRMFDQMMLFAIMLSTMCHFMAEQKSFQAISFIPLASWHKLVNTFLLIE